MIQRYAIFILVLFGAVVIAVAMQRSTKKYWNHVDRSKYIKFSHTFHVKEQGIACEDCHTKAKESTHSFDNLIGDHVSCQTCHEEQISSNCTYCHTNNDNIISMANPERELMFSHQLHADKLSVKCEDCHAGVDAVTYITAENMPTMESCTNCHSQQKVSTTCETCHTNFATLIPSDHQISDFRKHHKELTRVGMTDVSCRTCHDEGFCQDCHSGSELQSFGFRKDLIVEPAPRSPERDSPKQLKLEQVHSLNYRFTHGIDARSKDTDCASCHESQTFCADCHATGGNITQKKFKPASHSVAGFTTIGKGTGGGKHADLARRDIESCVSCHDVQGSDPSCMLCHSETGVVR